MKILIPIPCLILYNTYMLQTGIGIAGGTAILEFYRIVFLNRKGLRLFCGSPVRPITILSQNFTANNCKKNRKEKKTTQIPESSGIDGIARIQHKLRRACDSSGIARNRAESRNRGGQNFARTRPPHRSHRPTPSGGTPLRGNPQSLKGEPPKGGTA